MDLSFIIPAYNEAARIEKSLAQAREYFAPQAYTWEVVVVDDGSSDDTAAIVEHHSGDGIRLLRQPRNMGKGAAVRRGMLEGRGNFRIFSDADFSTPIRETERMLKELRHHDVVIGSRAIDSSYIKKHQPWYRETMGRIFNLFVRMIAVSGIHDTQCGFKGFTAAAAEAVFSRTKIDGFSFDVEALYIARRLGLSILEMPVEWFNDERSTLNPVSDSIKMFRELLRVRALHRGFDPSPRPLGQQDKLPAA
ncbi:MAG TPA: dolichyl-phosphate beta-glucosyltransferase [Candidatus Kapabacteria bacterium]|nr:dolichyl-phosphate beta-glucosyltransferase [Candidatus Kapabacteria bacterium]